MKLQLHSLCLCAIILMTVFSFNTISAQDHNPISIDENNVLYYNGKPQVDLSPYLDNSDEQIIWRDNNVVGVKNGGEVDISDLKDNTDDQFLFKFGHNVFLEDGSQFSLEQYLDNTDAQQISAVLENKTLSLSIDNGNTVDVNLAAVVEPTQNLVKDLMNKLEALTTRVEELEKCACYTTRHGDAEKSTDTRGNGAKDKDARNTLEVGSGSKLYQNIPNPFQSTSSIKYYIPETSKNAQLQFASTAGNVVSQVNITERGNGQLDINPSQLASGVYLYSLIVDGQLIATRKMVIKN